MHLDTFNHGNDYPVLFPHLDLCPVPPTPMQSFNYPFDMAAENEFQQSLYIQLQMQLETEFREELEYDRFKESLTLYDNNPIKELPIDDDLIFVMEL